MPDLGHDPISLLVQHNRRAIASMLAAARNVPMGDLNRAFGFGLGSFREAVLSCLQPMVYWADQVEGGAPRRLLVMIDANGKVVAIETRSVHALQTMLQAVADGFEEAVSRARPRLEHSRDWTLRGGSVMNATVAKAILHALLACAAHRQRALMILEALNVSITATPAIGLIPVLHGDASRQSKPQDPPEVSS